MIDSGAGRRRTRLRPLTRPGLPPPPTPSRASTRSIASGVGGRWDRRKAASAQVTRARQPTPTRRRRCHAGADVRRAVAVVNLGQQAAGFLPVGKDGELQAVGGGRRPASGGDAVQQLLAVGGVQRTKQHLPPQVGDVAGPVAVAGQLADLPQGTAAVRTTTSVTAGTWPGTGDAGAARPRRHRSGGPAPASGCTAPRRAGGHEGSGGSGVDHALGVPTQVRHAGRLPAACC